MESAVLAGRALLALVFAAAGAAKLRDRNSARRALTDFGVPAPGGFWYTTDDGQRHEVSRSASARECDH